MNNQLIVLAFKDFLADFEKQDGRHSHFPIFVTATVLKLSGKIRYHNRLLESTPPPQRISSPRDNSKTICLRPFIFISDGTSDIL